jgi:predicted dehydrogenase
LLLEKPVSHTLDDVAPLQHLVEQHKLTAMVGYNLRFHRVLQTVKTLLEREAVGTIVSVRAWSGQYLPDWHPGEDYRQSYMAHVDLGGGIILTMSHELDYLYWFFGRVAQIVAVTSHPPTLEMATESLAEITLIFQHDLVAQVHLDCLQRVPSRGCEIIGSDGTIHCDINRATVSLHRPGGDATTILQKHSYDNNEPYLAELNHLRECIQSGQSPLIPLGEGIDVLALALAAHRSAATGTRQTCEQHLTHIRTWSG